MINIYSNGRLKTHVLCSYPSLFHYCPAHNSRNRNDRRLCVGQCIRQVGYLFRSTWKEDISCMSSWDHFNRKQQYMCKQKPKNLRMNLIILMDILRKRNLFERNVIEWWWYKPFGRILNRETDSSMLWFGYFLMDFYVSGVYFCSGHDVDREEVEVYSHKRIRSGNEV